MVMFNSFDPRKFHDLVIGKSLDSLNPATRHYTVLAAFLAWRSGAVPLLVVLERINVFLTFSLPLLGLSELVTRPAQRAQLEKKTGAFPRWLPVTGSILLVALVEKFGEGGGVTVVITCLVVGLCLFIHWRYEEPRDSH